jgi:glyoxylase-like metal-dependent hydrolase (beta-lactamase superfamily II)
MESVVVGQENGVSILQNRPTSARSQEIDAGADWEPFDLPPNIRWVLPEMTFSRSISIYWGEIPLLLEHHSGSHLAGSWLKLENEKVVFTGDSVVIHQPPFLAFADLDAWVKDLDLLLSDEYKGYKIVSGRSGVVRPRSIEKMRDVLIGIKQVIEVVAAEKGEIEDLLAEVPGLLKPLNFNKSFTQLYHNRLSWGLEQYYKRHYLHVNDDQKGES